MSRFVTSNCWKNSTKLSNCVHDNAKHFVFAKFEDRTITREPKPRDNRLYDQCHQSCYTTSSSVLLSRRDCHCYIKSRPIQCTACRTSEITAQHAMRPFVNSLLPLVLLTPRYWNFAWQWHWQWNYVRVPRMPHCLNCFLQLSQTRIYSTVAASANDSSSNVCTSTTAVRARQTEDRSNHLI